MKILNYGSLNIDLIFSVPHIVREGETISSQSMVRSAGGKGANQSAALAKAGCETYHAGKIGHDGLFLKELLDSYGVDTRYITVTDNPSGQAIIQLSEASQNSIILMPGENRNITTNEMDSVLAGFGRQDWLVLQNEINGIGYLLEAAHERGMSICLNPAPMDASIEKLPLEYVDLLVVNEIEGADLAGEPLGTDPREILLILAKRFPNTEVIVTAGKDGAYHAIGDCVSYQAIVDAPVVDTTAAGDTFIGYFLASRARGEDVPHSLYYATFASSITVSRMGAMDSIPLAEEVFG